MSVTVQEIERGLNNESTTAEGETQPGMLQPSAPELENLPVNEYFCVFGVMGETMSRHRKELERQMAEDMHRMEIELERRLAEGIRNIEELISPTPIQSPTPPEEQVQHGPENRQSCWLALWKRLSACKPCQGKDVPHGTIAPPR